MSKTIVVDGVEYPVQEGEANGNAESVSGSTNSAVETDSVGSDGAGTSTVAGESVGNASAGPASSEGEGSAGEAPTPVALDDGSILFALNAITAEAYECEAGPLTNDMWWISAKLRAEELEKENTTLRAENEALSTSVAELTKHADAMQRMIVEHASSKPAEGASANVDSMGIPKPPGI